MKQVKLKRQRHRRRLETMLSSSEVANLCGVAPRTVSKWVDAGKIPGAYRIPGNGKNPAAGDRRIPSEGLMLFFRENGMPVPRELRAVLLSGERRALLVGTTTATWEAVRSMQPEWELVATGLVGAGFHLAHHRKVVIDLSAGWCEGQELAALVGEFSPNSHVILIHPDDRQPPIAQQNQTWLTASCSQDDLKAAMNRDCWNPLTGHRDQ